MPYIMTPLGPMRIKDGGDTRWSVKAAAPESEQIDLSKESIKVFDYGIFLPVAQRLARDFGSVDYYVPWKSGFACSNKAYIGKGMPGINRVHDFWKGLDKETKSVIMFPDMYDSDIQAHLRGEGHPVFGTGDGEDFELNRDKFYAKLKEIGLPVAPYEKVVGITALTEKLKKLEDKYLKFNMYRGDAETKKWISYDLNKSWLDKLTAKLGPRKEEVEVLICDTIPDAVEIGYDGWCVDGQYPAMGGYGYEDKGCGYIGRACSYSDIPGPIRLVNEKFAPVLAQSNYRGFYSTEIRYTKDKTPYFIDPTMRAGYPPSCTQTELWANYSKNVRDIAHGKLPSPVPAGKYGGEVILRSPLLCDIPIPVSFPKEIEQWVKLNNACYVDGQYWINSIDGMDRIGSVVAIGDSIEEVENKCLSMAEQVRAVEIEYDKEVFNRLRQTVENGINRGIEF